MHWSAGGPAHQLRNESDADAVYLVFGTDRDWDVIEFQEREELYVKALDQVGRLDVLEYYDGELDPP